MLLSPFFGRSLLDRTQKMMYIYNVESKIGNSDDGDSSRIDPVQRNRGHWLEARFGIVHANTPPDAARRKCQYAAAELPALRANE